MPEQPDDEDQTPVDSETGEQIRAIPEQVKQRSYIRSLSGSL